MGATSDMPKHGHAASLRLRGGIALWLASWIPLPLILGITGPARYVIWGLQFAIGQPALPSPDRFSSPQSKQLVGSAHR